jgi:hypothetical protein
MTKLGRFLLLRKGLIAIRAPAWIDQLIRAPAQINCGYEPHFISIDTSSISDHLIRVRSLTYPQKTIISSASMSTAQDA